METTPSPCLCGDPLCPRCFPGQRGRYCKNCGNIVGETSLLVHGYCEVCEEEVMTLEEAKETEADIYLARRK